MSRFTLAASTKFSFTVGSYTTLAVYQTLRNLAVRGHSTDEDYPIAAVIFGLIKGIISFFE